MQLRPVSPARDFDPSKVITNPKPINDKDKRFTDDGIFSPRIFGKLDGSSESFSCLCGEVKGRFHSGETCPRCSERVKYRMSDVTRKGWIDLGERQVVNPFFFKQIDKVFAGQLESVLSYERKMDGHGNIKSNEDEECPFRNTGMSAFAEPEVFLEALSWFYNKNKTKAGVPQAYEFILENSDLIFMSKIPVYSAILRPATMINQKFTFAQECVDFNQIIANVAVLNGKRKIERGPLSELGLLFEIQQLVVKIHDKLSSILIGKTGFLRGTLLGSRVNFSVRTVISPIPAESGFGMNELRYPYLAAVELYKFEIINLLARSTGTYEEAQRIWFESTLGFSRRVWEVLCELVERTEGGLSLILNRNPTIQIGSMLYCVIREVKTDYSDCTLNVSNNVLQLLGGDYDGDVVTTIGLKDLSMKRHFARFDPRNMVLDNNSGTFNRAMAPSKDYMLGLAALLR